MTTPLQPFPFPPGLRAQAWRYQPKYRRPVHFHAEPELNLVWRGHGRMLVGSQTFSVKRGSLVLLPPGIDHGLLEASADLEFFAVGFRPQLVDVYAERTGLAPALSMGCTELPRHTLDHLTNLCHELGEHSDPASGEVVLSEFFRHAQAGGVGSELGARAACLLRQKTNLERNFLAKSLASNRGDVSRQFRRHNGITLREFKKRIRVLQFLDMVDSHTDNLTRAAVRAGFGSYSQCYRDFCSVIGLPPREFLTTSHRAAIADHFEPLAREEGSSSSERTG